ncbi:MAG TPA: beta-ketoacyl-ACP synthase 3, partial [Marmoricola sp.]|nr:beta-ketoacyl-ACP synthase 3 [Marmoricola sp.]
MTATTTGTAILGVGAYRGSRVIPNSEIIDKIDSSDEWIRTRSGIVERRWATAEETVELMALNASQEAIERSGVEADQIGLVIVATVTHMLQTPSLATMVAHKVGATDAAAFDISAACAGFCHGLALARDAIKAGSTTYALVIGVERLSDLTDPYDRGTAFIFADGAGAAVIGPSDIEGIGPVVWGSDGGNYDLIRQKEDWLEIIGSENPGMPHIIMEGNSVFRWAVYTMAKVAQQTLEKTGITADELDVFIPHQANMRIVDALARAAKLPDKV